MDSTRTNDPNEYEGRENGSVAITSNSEIDLDVVCDFGASPPGVNDDSSRESLPKDSSRDNLSGNSSCLGLLGDTPHSTVMVSGEDCQTSGTPEQGKPPSLLSTPPLTPDSLITEAMLSEEQTLRDTSCVDEKEKVVCAFIH